MYTTADLAELLSRPPSTIVFWAAKYAIGIRPPTRGRTYTWLFSHDEVEKLRRISKKARRRRTNDA